MTANGRTPLADAVVELLTAVGVEDASTEGLRISDVALTVPIELEVVQRDGQPTVFGNAMRWRWSTPFDPPVSRMSLRIEIEAAA